jgi:serine protease inhibitor
MARPPARVVAAPGTRDPPFLMLPPRAVPVLLASAALLAGCDRVLGPGASGATWTAVPLDARVTDAYADFCFDLFRRLRAEDPTGNLFVSPTSAAFALAMTYNGAAGETAREMALALGVGDLDRELLNRTTRTWMAALRKTGDPRAELAVANSVWYRETHRIRESFRQQVRTYFDAEIQPIGAARVINAWVDRATRGRIDEIIQGEIPGDVVAYLINAVYFKADWTHQFRVEETRSAPFHRLDGSTVAVPMMSQTGSFDLRADAEVEMLRLPYGAGRFSMVLALPREGSDLATVARRLDAARWRAWMAEFVATPRLDVRLPRFEVEWESSLVEALHGMGMEAPFQAGRADFSEMFERPGPWIDEVLQKTYLRVDEKGAEAAAVTAVVMAESAAPSIAFDRPFFLAIYDHATETVLFLGQVTDPTAT